MSDQSLSLFDNNLFKKQCMHSTPNWTYLAAEAMDEAFPPRLQEYESIMQEKSAAILNEIAMSKISSIDSRDRKEGEYVQFGYNYRTVMLEALSSESEDDEEDEILCQEQVLDILTNPMGSSNDIMSPSEVSFTSDDFSSLEDSVASLVSVSLAGKLLSREHKHSPLSETYTSDTNETSSMVETLKLFVQKRYSTTSSVFADTTIGCPDASQLLFGIATVIQAQICEDLSSAFVNIEGFKDFDIIPELPPESGGIPFSSDSNSFIETGLCTKSLIDLDDETNSFCSNATDTSQTSSKEISNKSILREKFLSGAVPSLTVIYNFLRHIFIMTNYSPECNIVALYYINRIRIEYRMPVTSINWRILWASAIIIAQKVWDDKSMKTSEFVNILPSISKNTLKRLEFKTFSLLKFETSITVNMHYF
jgi:hypothetical protein